MTDKKFSVDQRSTRQSNKVFIRLVAIDKTFFKVDFKYTFFESCYLRNCKFDSCDFTGCRFTNTQLPGATFSGCKFDYTTFEKTFIDESILDTECPAYENLKMRFARSLRLNFQQLGDAAAVNRAMAVELDATEVHLRKAWQSNDSYYRTHHQGLLARIIAFLKWANFKFFDFVWGNGEKLHRLIISALVIVSILSVIDNITFGRPNELSGYLASFFRSIAIFFGTLAPDEYGGPHLAAIAFIRLVCGWSILINSD